MFAILGGLLATIGVFIAIPLTQKLSDAFESTSPPPPEFTVDPPDEQSFDTEEPPPETEDEPEPEEMPEEPSEIDLGIDLGDLTLGTGGGFVMEVPDFAMKGGDDPFGGGDLDSAPVPVTKMPPVYPASLLSKGVGGRVLITCVVSEEGTIASTSIKQSSGQSELDKAALAAVNKWKFKPGTKGGKKVKSTCIVPFNFEVKKN
ncbi:energy transducer TonB [Luteolibacter pohnpeiensis]|uniref:Energy transducer TonB n=1 Tax=Luteolibacter pohnpeiensis TaxID=454153 RepID=A0A934S8P9_9BACT|nr:energy transducer TonB [Luteolibacter pohnpeiensis]MBK1884207.1 energy transducer TonB [Luteolibacter pohnpeiensis]